MRPIVLSDLVRLAPVQRPVSQTIRQTRACGRKNSKYKEAGKNKEYRKVTQPWNFPCAGSIFRNPLPYYAGRLVEDAGLKGYRIGGAQISDMHGNFIINAGNAKAEDVLQLIDYVKKTIYDSYNVIMETEVEIIGRK